MRRSLPVLDAAIEARAYATRGEHPWWPCGEGCDRCCRSLPSLPIVTRPEWERLESAIRALEPSVFDDVVRRIRNTPQNAAVVCPMLDEKRGTCRVYDARPLACRAYGFYVERDGGLHCGKVTDAVERHAADGELVTWGNGEALADDIRSLGLARSIRTWFEDAESHG
jgi:uncharacterized protein